MTLLERFDCWQGSPEKISEGYFSSGLLWIQLHYRSKSVEFIVSFGGYRNGETCQGSCYWQVTNITFRIAIYRLNVHRKLKSDHPGIVPQHNSASSILNFHSHCRKRVFDSRFWQEMKVHQRFPIILGVVVRMRSNKIVPCSNYIFLSLSKFSVKIPYVEVWFRLRNRCGLIVLASRTMW